MNTPQPSSAAARQERDRLIRNHLQLVESLARTFRRRYFRFSVDHSSFERAHLGWAGFEPAYLARAGCRGSIYSTPNKRRPRAQRIESTDLTDEDGLRSRSWASPPVASLDDLIAYGNLGLVEAADDFDPSRGTPFSTYAFYRIRRRIFEGVQQLGLPRRAWKSRKVPHLDMPASPSSEGETEQRLNIALALEQLPDRERALIRSHYFADESIETVAASLGVSTSAAVRLRARALKALAKALLGHRRPARPPATTPRQRPRPPTPLGAQAAA